MSQRLIITWDRKEVIDPPFIESFFTRSVGGAKNILDNRVRENMQSAMYQGKDLLVKRKTKKEADEKKTD